LASTTATPQWLIPCSRSSARQASISSEPIHAPRLLRHRQGLELADPLADVPARARRPDAEHRVAVGRPVLFPGRHRDQHPRPAAAQPLDVLGPPVRPGRLDAAHRPRALDRAAVKLDQLLEQRLDPAHLRDVELVHAIPVHRPAG
jgi:hypothetical protein